MLVVIVMSASSLLASLLVASLALATVTIFEVVGFAGRFIDVIIAVVVLVPEANGSGDLSPVQDHCPLAARLRRAKDQVLPEGQSQ